MNIQTAFNRLITCPEPLRWHPEGFTGIHSAIVAARAILSGAVVGKNGRSLLMAALLHDIGKPTSGWMVDGAWINHNHPQDGYDIIMSNDDIRHAVASVADLDHVADLTRLHMGLKAYALGESGFPHKANGLPYADLFPYLDEMIGRLPFEAVQRVNIMHPDWQGAGVYGVVHFAGVTPLNQHSRSRVFTLSMRDTARHSFTVPYEDDKPFTFLRTICEIVPGHEWFSQLLEGH